jgi:hypothetical protein
VSDLQCPARFIVVSSVDDLDVVTFAEDRVAAVYDAAAPTGGSGPGPGDLHALADRLGLPVVPAERRVLLEEVRERAPYALAVLSALADLHRGETVLLRADGEPGGRVEIGIDGDGALVIG